MLIVADDLTGALDTGAVLRRQGFSAAVALDLSREPASRLASFEVVAITTETRYAPEPGESVRRLAAFLPRRQLIYKKIDSTLRGAVGEELMAMLDITGLEAALLAPAFPAQGRGLADGYLVVGDSQRQLHLPTLIAEQTGSDVAHVPLEVIRGPAGALLAMMNETLGAGSRLVVADALVDDDLGRLADAVAHVEIQLLLSGSAGFASWLPRAWTRRPTLLHADHSTTTGGPVLFVLGSANPQTRVQIRALVDADAMLVEVEPEPSVDDEKTQGTSIRALAEGRDLVLALAPHGDMPIDVLPPDQRRHAATKLASVARRVVDMTPVSALVVGGGDTAYALCVELGIKELVLDGEATPGLPRSHARTAAGRDVRLVTKAGGFGGENALLLARQALLDGNK